MGAWGWYTGELESPMRLRTLKHMISEFSFLILQALKSTVAFVWGIWRNPGRRSSLQGVGMRRASLLTVSIFTMSIFVLIALLFIFVAFLVFLVLFFLNMTQVVL
jgi:hypothetical protein